MPYMALYKLKLLDEFEDRIDLWTFAEFEKRLIELWRGATYHDAKGIINAAHKERRWPRVVKRYLLTHYKVFGNVEPGWIARLPKSWRRCLRRNEWIGGCCLLAVQLPDGSWGCAAAPI
ncbi:hypothetical protein DBADOPDK_02390 [Pseudomonas sp. MM223]|nr:hypothetical protein DBADOPDK_02390 [Pseudomonas sp. MM223]